ncbi:MAG: glycerate kinase [Deltaproteobacteria bacterium]|nr:glycerate kinase [Deltaproteobacteria bacterium]
MNLLGREYLEGIFRAAVASADPARLVREALRVDADGVSVTGMEGSASVRFTDVKKVFLVGGGKAGRAMGEAAMAALAGRVAAGAISVPPGEGGSAGRVRFVEAGHPVPDKGSREAAREIRSLLAGAGEKDLVVALLSGGGSSMISAPAEGVPPADKESVLRLLLRSGADIVELNTVRKHLSAVKGGLLARAARPARVLALLLSDVPGDDPSVVASGPFSPDPTTFEDAREVLARRCPGGRIPAAARAYIDSGIEGGAPETPKPGDPAFERVACVVVGSNRTALAAAAAEAEKVAAATVRVLPGFLRGESRECAREFVARLRQARSSLPPGGTVVLIAGGETTVTVRGGGKGGRNQEFALAAAIEMEGEGGMSLLCGGTDGIDGPTDAAGAVSDGSTCARTEALGCRPRERLEDNDAYRVFSALGDLVRTGRTGTNVADLAIGVAAS